MNQPIYYVVAKAEYASEDIMENGAVFTRPTNEIDSRTIKEQTFRTLEEAEKFANDYYQHIKGPEEWKWLAYLKISKCVKEPIKVFKEMTQ